MLFNRDWGVQRERVALGQNLLTQPNSFSTWTIQRGTLTSRGGWKSPNGDNSASRFIEDTSVTTSHNVAFTLTAAIAAVPYRLGVFCRKISNNPNQRDMYLQAYDSAFDSGVQLGCLLDGGAQPFAAGVSFGTNFTNVSGRVQRHADKWYECVMIFTPPVDTAISVFLSPMNTGLTNSYTGDGASGFDIWGASLRVL